MAPELTQPRDDPRPRVEALVDVLQAIAGDRLDADERAENPRPFHRVEKRGILGGLHGDLRVEHEILRQLRQPRHELEALGAQRLELA